MTVKLYACSVRQSDILVLNESLMGVVGDKEADYKFINSTPAGAIYHVVNSTVEVCGNRKGSNVRIHANTDNQAEKSRDMMQRLSGLELIKGDCWGR